MSNSNAGGGAFYGSRRATLAQIGGALGIAGNCIGWLIFCLLCAGFSAAATLSPLPLLLGIVGIVLSIVGAVFQKHAGDTDTHVLAALCINIFAIVGGLMEMGVWMHWQVVWGVAPRVTG